MTKFVARAIDRRWLWAAATCVCSVGTLAVSTPAAAYEPLGPPGYKWPGGVYNYRINVASFQNNLPGLSLTAAQVGFWVPYALSVWRERTGIDGSLTLNYVSTSSASNGTCTNHDGFNQIYVVAGCRGGTSPPCTTYGESKTWPNLEDPENPPTGPITEADTCIYGGSVGPTSASCSGDWRVRIDNFPDEDKDLIGLLVHEFGHALGLGHEFSTVMQSDNFDCGSILARYPYGDDIDGMRSLYGYGSGGIPHAYWRHANLFFSAETPVPQADGVWPVLAGIGRSGSGTKVVIGELSDTGDTIAFNRAIYPLSGGSILSAPSAAVDTWRPPAIAGRPPTYSSSELWTAAVAKTNQLASDCNRLRIYRSTDTFSNFTHFDSSPSSGCGSMHEPALTFDPWTGRFVMLYVRHEAANSGLSDENGSIYAMTSTDGMSWTSPQDIGFYTNDAVDAACGSSLFGPSCLMTYVRASSNDQTTVNRSFSVDANGRLVVGSSTQSLPYAERTPAVGSHRPNPLPVVGPSFLIASPSAAGESSRSNSAYTLNVASSITTPFPAFVYLPWVFAGRRGSLASIPGNSQIYLWYVR